MKYFSTLFIAIALMAVGTVNAQTASKLNGQSYTYMMKNMDGTGEEIIDQITFGVAQGTSKELSKTGFTKGTVVERNAGQTSEFDMTFTKANGDTYLYKGTAEGVTFHGTITVTAANGTQQSMLFRGMLTEEWNNMLMEKQKAKELREKK